MLALVAAPQRPETVELREVDVAVPAEGEAVVEVRAVSLNRGEVNRLASAPDGWRPGWDVAGVVARRGDDGPEEGSRVVGIVEGGGWAERVCVATANLARLPDGVSFTAAAALPVAGITALRALRRCGLVLGRRVLITGAAGGVGRFAVQLARLAGAEVTAVVGSPERGAGLRELGAAAVVTGVDGLDAGSYDAVLDSAGGESLAACLRAVGPGGTVVTFGNSSRAPTTFVVNDLYAGERTLAGYFIFTDVRRHPAAADLAILLDLVASRRLDPHVSLEVDWQHAPRALEALRERRVPGKAVLRVKPA